MSQLSDTAPTLAVVAAFADGPTRDHRDRVHPRQGDRPGRQRGRRAAPARGRRHGGARRLHHPPAARCRAATVQTYDDHRMAMAFALAGLRFDGVQIADPGVRRQDVPWLLAPPRGAAGPVTEPALWSGRP